MTEKETGERAGRERGRGGGIKRLGTNLGIRRARRKQRNTFPFEVHPGYHAEVIKLRSTNEFIS